MPKDKPRKNLTIFKKSKQMRRWLLQNPWVRPMCVFNYAAILIQKTVRAHLSRRRSGVSNPKRFHSSKRRKIAVGKQLDKYMSFLDRCQRSENKPLWLNDGFSAWCAVRIQSIVRMRRLRRRYLLRKYLVAQVAAIIIQTQWRNAHLALLMSNPQSKTSLTNSEAAQKIQLLWRTYCNRRMYRYLRDLLLIKLKAAPVPLLRSIIPNEAALLDRAAGVHVKFRLGGSIFPPKVYFKIFTHRPLCDINAFAPRDYMGEKDYSRGNGQHSGGGIKVGAKYFEIRLESTNPEGSSRWYRRVDGNSWRMLSSHHYTNLSIPPWFQDSCHTSKPQLFHYNRLHRLKDYKRFQKRRKRHWMQRWLQPDQSPVDDNGIEKQKRENNGEKFGDLRTDPDEGLIAWSAALDFDDYVDHWRHLASSIPSDVSFTAVLYREGK